MKQDQVEYVTNVDAFISNNNLRQLFASLTRELTLVQPDDPLSYLISYLQSHNHQRMIFVHGINKGDTTSLCNSLSIKFNYTLIDLFGKANTEDINSVENHKLSELLKENIKSIQKSTKGIVVCGYPNNHIQGEYIQRNGLLPERLFVLPHDIQTMDKYYIDQGNTPNKAKLLNSRNTMNTQELKILFGQLVDVLPQSLDQAKTVASNILKIKDKHPFPLESPRIVAIHPPYLQPDSLKQLCSQYGIELITIESSFLKFKSQKNTFREYVRKFQHFTRELELAIVQTACTSVVAKKKGFVLAGWPNSTDKLHFLKEHYIKPHMILAFFDEKGELQKMFNKLQPHNHQVFPLDAKPTLQEFQSRMEEYNRLLGEIKKDPRTQLFEMNTPEKDVIRAIEVGLGKPQVYK